MAYTKDINLIPAKKGFEGRFKEKAGWVSAAMAVLATLTVLTWILPHNRLEKLKKENIAVIRQIEELRANDNLLSTLNEKKQRLNYLKRVHEAILSEKVDVLGLLNKIAGVLPENIYVSSMSINNGTTINANFISRDPVDTIRLIVRLKQTEFFEEVELASVSIKPAGHYIIPLNLKLKKEPERTDNAADAAKTAKGG